MICRSLNKDKSDLKSVSIFYKKQHLLPIFAASIKDVREDLLLIHIIEGLGRKLVQVTYFAPHLG
jgi:hypothetical protein